MELEREQGIKVLQRYTKAEEVQAKLQRRGITTWESEEEMYAKFYDLHLKFPTRPELARGIPQEADGRASDPLFEIMWGTRRHVWLRLRYDFKEFPKGYRIVIGWRLFDLIGIEFTDLIQMGVTKQFPWEQAERWDYAMFLHYVTEMKGVQLPDTKTLGWKFFEKKKKQEVFYDQSFLDFRRRYFKLNRKVFDSLLPFDVTLQDWKRDSEDVKILSTYKEMENENKVTGICIKVANTVVTDDVTSVLLHNMLSMYFLGENCPKFQTALDEFHDFIGYGQNLVRKANGSWIKVPGPTRLDGTFLRFRGVNAYIVDEDGKETPLNRWTGDSTVPWFHEEDYERQKRLQGVRSEEVW